VVETAFRLRDLLAAEGLDCWPKTTGGNGLHVIVPITPGMTWDAAHDYSSAIPERPARVAPNQFITSEGPARASCS
jgi:bifunctional non-homologous end joining protein LigD